MLTAKIAAGLFIGFITAVFYLVLTQVLFGWESASQGTLLSFSLGALGGIWIMTRR